MEKLSNHCGFFTHNVASDGMLLKEFHFDSGLDSLKQLFSYGKQQQGLLSVVLLADILNV